MSELPKIVIGVPGTWADHSDIVTSIALRSGGYLFAGAVMMHIETRAACTLEIYGRDPELRRSFEVAGGGRIPSDSLDAIEVHTNTLYISADGGSFESARTLMHAARALLSCGGLAVKVESTGIAHSADRWCELTEDESPASALSAFVTFVGDSGSFYSCGMHNIGYRDVVLTADTSPDEAAHLMHTFLLYLALEHPTMHDGETFGIDENAPRYRVTRSECTRFSAEDLFHNPYGVWHLAPA